MFYLEDLAAGALTWRRLLTAAQLTLLPAAWFYRLHGKVVDASAPAAILLSHEDDHAPAAVVLSHRNIMANCKANVGCDEYTAGR